jgi:ferredoxin-NADP reductase
LPDFDAGQHLPLELGVPARAESVRRTYSLSGAPGEGRYRISVKREPLGLASRHLHDAVEVGAIVDARAPAGDFVLGHDARPVVLVSAGVGVTPMLSMLHALARPGEPREAWFIHGARDGRHHPLAAETRTLVEADARLHLHVVYSQPSPEDEAGGDYDTVGRVDGDLIARLLSDLDAQYYLCGPTAFMAGVQGELLAMGVAREQIHAETFGPA